MKMVDNRFKYIMLPVALATSVAATAQTTGRGLTHAVDSVSGQTLQHTMVPNISNALAGQMAGLTVMQTTGEPGDDAATLTMRGQSTFGNDAMLVILDGFETTYSAIQYLTPAEIADVRVLKDAAATSLYGMKAAGGVLVVTTKRGTVSRPRIALSTHTGWQQAGTLPRPLRAYDYATLYNEAYSNDHGRQWTPYYSAADLEAWRKGGDAMHADTSWYDETLRSSAPTYNADLTFSGGSQAVRYFLLLGYHDNRGLYTDCSDAQNTTSTRYNMRANVDFYISPILEAQLNVGGKIEDRRGPGYDSNALWQNLAKYPANAYPARVDGKWMGNSTYPDNPLASLAATGYRSTHDVDLQYSFMLRENLDFLTPGLYLQEQLAFNNYSRGTYNKTRDYQRWEPYVTPGGAVDYRQTLTNTDTDYTILDDNGTNLWARSAFEVKAGYDRTFGRHALSAQAQYHQDMYRMTIGEDAAGGNNVNYGFRNVTTLANYMYADRYVAEIAVACSGSDNYLTKWHTYPTASVAWIASNEKFLSGAQRIDLLKLRLSAGLSGNDRFDGGRYLYQPYYTYGNGYGVGNAVPTIIYGIFPYRIANADFGPERSMKLNAGVDGAFFGKRLTTTVDAYYEKRSHIPALNNDLMATIGTDVPYENIGKMTSRGAELSVAYTDKSSFGLHYTVKGIFAVNANTIDYMAEEYRPESYMWRTGHRFGKQFGLVAEGLYDITDFDGEGRLLSGPTPGFGQVQPGDIKYRDLNADGVIDQRDHTVIGQGLFPKLNASLGVLLEWRGIDLQCLWQGVAGRDVNLLDAGYNTIAFVDNANAPEIAKNRWVYYPELGLDTRATATYPRLTTTQNLNNYQASTFWMHDGSFLRLKNVEVGYSLPSTLMQKNRMESIRLFFNATNVLTLSSLRRDYGMDPEVMNGYPLQKSFNFGINITL